MVGVHGGEWICQQATASTQPFMLLKFSGHRECLRETLHSKHYKLNQFLENDKLTHDRTRPVLINFRDADELQANPGSDQGQIRNGHLERSCKWRSLEHITKVSPNHMNHMYRDEGAHLSSVSKGRGNCGLILQIKFDNLSLAGRVRGDESKFDSGLQQALTLCLVSHPHSHLEALVQQLADDPGPQPAAASSHEHLQARSHAQSIKTMLAMKDAVTCIFVNTTSYHGIRTR